MRKRDIDQLSSLAFDVLVVGGGISGANIAWDAALRGLRVALLEKRDFGSATSANSMKTVHGGLRYLQDGNIMLVRKMVKERQALMRIAPHLVNPMPVIMPTLKNKLILNRLVMGTAVKINDILSFDRNVGMDPSRKLPKSQILSKHKTKRLVTGLKENSGITGAVLWYDAQVYNTERLLLSFILSAIQRGGYAVNYIGVKGFLREGKSVVGVKAVDELSGHTFHVRARVVVNATGPWVDELLSDLGTSVCRPRFYRSIAMNLVTRQINPDYAVGLISNYEHLLHSGFSEKRSRVLFIAPWRSFSLAGTIHAPLGEVPWTRYKKERMITDFIDELNRSYSGVTLSRKDICHVHWGFLPMEQHIDNPNTVKLIREGQVADHAEEDGIENLITAIGVKYTTARSLAEKTIDLVFKKLKKPSPPCQTRWKPIYGGFIPNFNAYLAASMERLPEEVTGHQLNRLLRNYGSNYLQLLPYFKANQAWRHPIAKNTHVTQAELLFAVHREMAYKLSDVVLRRTELGCAGAPDEECLYAAAKFLAPEMGWGRTRMEQEVKEIMDSTELI